LLGMALHSGLGRAGARGEAANWHPRAPFPAAHAGLGPYRRAGLLSPPRRANGRLRRKKEKFVTALNSTTWGCNAQWGGHPRNP
jgi:hypothetical protein